MGDIKMGKRKAFKDYVGSNAEVLGSMKVNKSDFDFIENIAEKHCWNNLARSIRMMVKFCKENESQFEEFIDSLRELS